MNTEFEKEVERNLRGIGEDASFLAQTREWVKACLKHNYTHNYSWMGRPVIQVPQDTCGLQQIIWEVKPDLIIETGIAHGGSLVFSASMLALLDYAEAVERSTVLNPVQPARKVLGIDICIRPHNRAALDVHPMRSRIEMIEGSSIDAEVIAQVKRYAADYKRIMVFLDSNHTHDHVLAELEAYAPLVTVGSYCVVMDTGVEDLPDGFVTNRPWGKGNNPKTAVRDYVKRHPEFSADKMLEWKLAITAAEDGYLKRLR